MVNRPPAKIVRGMPMLGPFAENWENVEKFQARPDDILIATYPKSGTTWISEIVDRILSGEDTDRSQRGAIYERVPFLEFAVPNMPTGTEALEKRKSPRVIKTHLSVDLLPKTFWDCNTKMIYVARNAKDVAVSYYHFYRMAPVHPEPGTFDEFLDTFMGGKAAFGPWSSHVKGWWQMAKTWDILYLFYEDMLQDPRSAIWSVAKCLGKDLSEDLLENIIQQTSFQAMKQNEKSNYTSFPSAVMDHSVSPFMRKGICGDWKNQFTVAQNERFDEHYKREMSNTDLSKRFLF